MFTCSTRDGHIPYYTSPLHLYVCAAHKTSLTLSSANAYSCIPLYARWGRYGFCILSFNPVESGLKPDRFWITEEYIVPRWDLFHACSQIQLTTTEKTLHRLQATEDSVGECLLWGKNNFEGCGWKITVLRTSTNNKDQELDHQGIAEAFVCLHICTSSRSV